MSAVVRIMVDETQPQGTVRVAPRIVVADPHDEGELLNALIADHKTIYCPSIEVAEKVRAVVAQTECLEEFLP